MVSLSNPKKSAKVIYQRGSQEDSHSDVFTDVESYYGTRTLESYWLCLDSGKEGSGVIIAFFHRG